jgi:hypothetical protein
MKTAAGASEGIAAQDVMGAKQLNQQGAQGMQGLYGTNVGAQLKAMGLADQDINTELQAQKAGPTWLSGLNQLSKATGDIGSIAGNASFIPGVDF